ncbi:MAG: S8 family serine peptidase [Deltaproteobacteria bacterium]|jgi:autotransporter-associated beta strand protein|nr:S8 family serine peptidase [Deltaproteobacteria bacterium]
MLAGAFAHEAHGASADDFRTKEYEAGNGLDSIHAAEAYALGYSGKGVTVGLIDSAYMRDHFEFAGKPSYVAEYITPDDPPDDSWHGLHVAGTIAASRNGCDGRDDCGMHGVAYDANIAVMVVSEVPPPRDYEYSLLKKEALLKLRDEYPEVQIISNSWGHDFNLAAYGSWKEIAEAKKTALLYADVISGVAASGTLLVFATGNEGRISPGIPASLPSLVTGTALAAGKSIPDYSQNILACLSLENEELAGLALGLIAVAAFDPLAYGMDVEKPTTRIDFLAEFSNLSLGAASYTLFAPGVDIYSSVGPAPEAYQMMSGTSMAAPHVSGVAALVKEAFPWMNGKQLADTLLSTATEISDAPPFVVHLSPLPKIDPDDPEEPLRGAFHLTVPESVAVAEVGNGCDYACVIAGNGDLRTLLDGHEEEIARLWARNPGFAADAQKFKELLEGLLSPGQPRNGDPSALADASGKDVGVHVVTDDEYSQVFGMGIVNAGAAVGGPGWLDANRLTDGDKLSFASCDYAMYPADTMGHDGLWSNSVGQVMAGEGYPNGADAPEPGPFNSELEGLKVGLLKQGEGRLTLTGDNWYLGPTAVAAGEIALVRQEGQPGEARLAGDVYVSRGAAFSGNGRVSGSLFSEGTLVPGLPGAPGSALTVEGDLKTDGTLRFAIQDDGNAALLVVHGTADVTGASVEFSGLKAGAAPAPSYSLIQAESLTGAAGLGGSYVAARQGATLQHAYALSAADCQGGCQIAAEYAGTELLPQSKSLSEGFLGGAILLGQATDLVAFRGVPEAAEAARGGAGGGSGPAAFAAASGGRLRYDTGSHVDADSLTVMAGLSLGTDTPAGRLTAAAFLEYGTGSYDTFNSFPNSPPALGGGDVRHAGGGALARMDFEGSGSGHFYAELSGRAGRVRNSYGSGDLRDPLGRAAGYDVSSSYFGAHAGLGRVLKITGSASIDVYAKYLWTRQEGASPVLSTGDPVVFAAAVSSRLRLGGRVSLAANDYATAYFGAGWEREFDGSAKAWTGGFPIDAPSLRGDTGVVDLGVTVRPSPSVPLSLELGVQGYAGKRRGITGGIQIRFGF